MGTDTMYNSSKYYVHFFVVESVQTF